MAEGELTSALKRGVSIGFTGRVLHDGTRKETGRLLKEEVIQRTGKQRHSQVSKRGMKKVTPPDLPPQIWFIRKNHEQQSNSFCTINTHNIVGPGIEPHSLQFFESICCKGLLPRKPLLQLAQVGFVQGCTSSPWLFMRGFIWPMAFPNPNTSDPFHERYVGTHWDMFFF